MPDTSKITCDTLLDLIGTPTCPILVDVCTKPDFAADPHLIPGAIRSSHSDLPQITRHLRGRSTIVLCQKGLKLSQGVAAWLRSEGICARYLEGGMNAWRDTAGAPRVPEAALPDRREGATLWAVPDDGHLETGACVWLIRRFIDGEARILHVSPDACAEVAQRFGAQALPRSPATFYALCEIFCLHTQPLDRLASVMRNTDTTQRDIAPEAAGVLAIWHGLSHRDPNDPAALAVFDALYRWAKRKGHSGASLSLTRGNTDV
ncbi:MAG: chromate resistance protein ChrB domain-containing protein [Pseudomonadota bacterium]